MTNFKALKVECTCQQQYVQVEGNGCTRYPLTQNWVNLKVLAVELVYNSVYRWRETAAHATR